MSSPTKISSSPAAVGAREGTRVILREITATLHNSPPMNSPANKSGNDSPARAVPEHEIKVKFAREFIEAASAPTTESSISSASSFQSLSSSLSTKSSSGICADSPTRSSDVSYSNLEIAGLDDLIAGCAGIRLETTIEASEQSFANETFTSATEDSLLNETLSNSVLASSEIDLNVTNTIESGLNATSVISDRLCPNLNVTQDLDIATIPENVEPSGKIIIPEVQEHNLDETAPAEVYTEQFSSDIGELTAQTFEVESNSTDSTTVESIEQPVLEVNDVVEPLYEPAEPSASSEIVFEETLSIDSPNSPDISAQAIKDPSEVQSEDHSTLIQPSLDAIVESSVVVAEKPEESLPIDGPNCPPVDSTASDIDFPLVEPVPELFADASLDYILTTDTPSPADNQIVLEKNILCESALEQSIVPAPEETYVISALDQTEDFSLKIDDDINDCLNTAITDDPPACFDQVDSSFNAEIVTDTAELTATQENLNVTHDLDQSEGLKADELNETLVNTSNILKTEEQLNFSIESQSNSCGQIALEEFSEGNTVVEERTEAAKDSYFDANWSFSADCRVEFEPVDDKFDQEVFNESLSASIPELPPQINDLFRDSKNFNFLLKKSQTNSNTRNLREQSLYLKFDPLVANQTNNMLPQGNGTTPATADERNGDKDVSLPNIDTPKRNPAIAAIDRLLFYSPSLENQKQEESVKIEPKEKVPEPVPVVDLAMVKELELVRSTVLQLEEQLQKQKEEHEKMLKKHQKSEEERQKAEQAWQKAEEAREQAAEELEKFRTTEYEQLQKELAQVTESKNQINLVVDEYEKSIGRLVAERERDRKNIDVEKACLLKELEEVKNHLAASEAAFNDVHAKYERLKVVVATSKNNEDALKESNAENIQIIKSLESRYEQLKTHAAAKLEKANHDLEGIRKHHESETVKLRAMLRKEELKTATLTEMIEQKTKENRKLTEIFDEMLAKVDASDDH